MDKNVIVIDDSDTEVPDVPSYHQANSSQPSTSQPSTSQPSASQPSTSATSSSRSKHSAQLHRVCVSRRRPLNKFERKRKEEESNSHPIARRRGYISMRSRQRKYLDDIPIDRRSVAIAKKSVPSKSSRRQQIRSSRRRQTNALLSATSSDDEDDEDDDRLLPQHRREMEKAKKNEALRQRLGQPKSRLRIPTKDDPESSHREFYVKSIEAKKIEEDIKNGYIVRVEERHIVQLDDLDPELLTGRPLTEKEAYWVKKKQARRAGPRSSSWPSIVPTHDQHTEYISLTDKARNMFDPNAEECSECGSKLWGTSILYPLSRPADSRPSLRVIDKDAPLCVGCSRLFSCVRDRREKLNLIYWIINGKTLDPMPPLPRDGSLMASCQKRINAMRSRAHKHYSELPSNFITAQQLFDDVKRDNFNCYLVGSPMRLESGYFNSLTFDHVFPISIAMMMPNCWSIENFQPMAFCMNQVKGNEANTEAKRWLINFKAHYFKADFK